MEEMSLGPYLVNKLIDSSKEGLISHIDRASSSDIFEEDCVLIAIRFKPYPSKEGVNFYLGFSLENIEIIPDSIGLKSTQELYDFLRKILESIAKVSIFKPYILRCEQAGKVEISNDIRNNP